MNVDVFGALEYSSLLPYRVNYFVRSVLKKLELFAMFEKYYVP